MRPGGGGGILLQSKRSRTNLPRCVGLVSLNLAATLKKEPCESMPRRLEVAPYDDQTGVAEPGGVTSP